MGVTLIGRKEAVEKRSPHLITGTIVIAIGGALIALAPQIDLSANFWAFPPGPPFMLLIGMIVLPVVLRSWRASRAAKPETTQIAVRLGVLTIIPLAAAIAFLGAGRTWGLVIFALVIPALLLSARFRVT